MRKELLNINQAGFSLVEALLSIVLFALIIGTFVSSLIYGQESERLAGDRARATFLAEEGLEAVRNLRDENFSNLVAGNHGLAISGDQWSFSGTSDTTDIFTRSISIVDVDADTKDVVANISWQQNQQRNGLISLTSRMTDWRISNPTQAEQLNADVFNVDIGGSGNASVIGMTIEDIGIEDIVIVSTEISWSGVPTNRNLNDILIDGGSVWTGNDSSGSVQDISDFTLVLGAGAYPIDYVFSGAVSGISMVVIFTMEDGSTKQVSFEPGVAPDIDPPADIADLSASGATINSIDLSWTAPGDDGNSGTASSYDIRYSTALIDSGNWDSASQVTGEPSPSAAGSSESMTVSGLSSGTLYYFAIKTSDEVPNISGLSNVVSATTPLPSQANYLIVNTASAQVNPANRTQVIGITLQNSGPANITIATMTVSWSGVQGNRRLTGITIGGISRWTGTATSGTTENITDVTIVSGATIPLDFLLFNNTLAGITVNISFTMTDGSTKTVSGIGPLP